jgi:hypothetical protein
MRARISLLILLWLWSAIHPGGLFAEEVTTEAQRIAFIIEKVVDAYGGKETIESIQGMHIKGNIEALMLRDHGTYALYFKRGRKLRVETKYRHSSEIRILNGDKGYRGTDVLPVEEVFGARYFAMVYHFKHLDLLHDLVKGTYQMQSMGKSSVGVSEVEVFHLNDKDGAIMDVYIDTHKFLILKVTGYFKEKDKEIDLSVEFSDFKKVSRTVFPFRITNYAGGLKIAQTVIDSYLLNPDIADFLFEPATARSL